MFAKYIKEKYKDCYTKETFYNIRKDLEKHDKELFSKELEFLNERYNPLANIVLNKSRDKYVDYGNFILTQDKYNKMHFLLIPKNLSYFNVLTLKKEDIVMLNEMKKLIFKHLGTDYILYFHCYPYNSIHTLHMHVVHKNSYIFKNNNLMIDDVIYVLELN